MSVRAVAPLFLGILLALLLAAACHMGGSSSKIHSTPVQTTQVVGPDGGDFTVNGVELVIPAGALTASTTLTVISSSGSVSAPFVQVGKVYTISPTSLDFAQRITILLPMPSTDLDSDIDFTSLRVYRASDSGSQDWAALDGGLTAVGSQVEGTVGQLGSFAIGGANAVDGDFGLGQLTKKGRADLRPK